MGFVSSSVFFFSSRRRHTRCYRDWSSDVCSSDLSSWKPPGTRAPGARGASGRAATRSEERRVGKEGRSRWSPDHLKKKKNASTFHNCNANIAVKTGTNGHAVVSG